MLTGADLRLAIVHDAKLGNVLFDGTRVHRADLRGATGLDGAHIVSIDVGEIDPVRLDGDTARAWLVDRISS
ncbi:MAG TPA: hypothetical protein VHN14_30145 [Kofleriaceae bacterium]|nr:hypothetical protein [Kofleriaceae bacterium]